MLTVLTLVVFSKDIPFKVVLARFCPSSVDSKVDVIKTLHCKLEPVGIRLGTLHIKLYLVANIFLMEHLVFSVLICILCSQKDIGMLSGL